MALICTSRMIAATRRDLRQIGGSRTSATIPVIE